MGNHIETDTDAIELRTALMLMGFKDTIRNANSYEWAVSRGPLSVYCSTNHYKRYKLILDSASWEANWHTTETLLKAIDQYDKYGLDHNWRE